MKVFYSWQSDLDKKSTHYYIKDCLKFAIEQLNEKSHLEIRLDHDTQGLAGTPDISSSIFEKISQSDVFVGDISIINSGSVSRKTPNPNVLIELGYAISTLGWDNIILIYNENYAKIEELPFDLRGRRILKFRIKHEDYKDKEKKKNFQGQIKYALQMVVDIKDKSKTVTLKPKLNGTIEFNKSKFLNDQRIPILNYKLNLFNEIESNSKSVFYRIFIDNILIEEDVINLLSWDQPYIKEMKMLNTGINIRKRFRLEFGNKGTNTMYSEYNVLFRETGIDIFNENAKRNYNLTIEEIGRNIPL